MLQPLRTDRELLQCEVSFMRNLLAWTVAAWVVASTHSIEQVSVCSFNIQVFGEPHDCLFLSPAPCPPSLWLSVCKWPLSLCGGGRPMAVGTSTNDERQPSAHTVLHACAGQSKMAKAGVPETLVRIIKAFDVVFIQEIRDSAMTSPGELLDLVNVGLSAEEEYALLLSPRYGNIDTSLLFFFLFRFPFVEEGTRSFAALQPVAAS